ncbi:MAG: hypothetical protein HY978_02255 [Candidatus Liptonbacteria bacterium]|nr:hypothetical protein [Candidatus Liptonbacteria bacterium]
MQLPRFIVVALMVIIGGLMLGNVAQFWYTYNVALPTAERADVSTRTQQMLLTNLSKRIIILEQKVGLR